MLVELSGLLHISAGGYGDLAGDPAQTCKHVVGQHGLPYGKLTFTMKIMSYLYPRLPGGRKILHNYATSKALFPHNIAGQLLLS